MPMNQQTKEQIAKILLQLHEGHAEVCNLYKSVGFTACAANHHQDAYNCFAESEDLLNNLITD